MSDSKPADVWARGDAYERYVGRWSRRVAIEFVDWLGMPAAAAWLDVGSGSGALAETVLERALPSRVHGIDMSPGFVEHAKSRITDARATFVTADAEQIPVSDASFDAAVSGLVLNFVPHPERAVLEMARAVRPGGCVAAYVWDYAGQMQLMRHFWDAAAALDPKAAELDEGRRFPLCQKDRFAELFQKNERLTDVEARAIDVATRFSDFDDYWTPFLGGQGPAPSYVASLDERAEAALRERLRAALPVRADGSIELSARAWAVRAQRR